MCSAARVTQPEDPRRRDPVVVPDDAVFGLPAERHEPIPRRDAQKTRRGMLPALQTLAVYLGERVHL